ncbi:unnamed protein product [Ceutorhynchus assimilis]|uniref:Myb-like domain-containing protein n=1 Tax=Ceutorhynchus assimilis TaxID=467358 RepID=A0A9N9QNN7_9CUCU|nr:unnamed protein product [Ceutorhynchus assimilis]
MDQLGTVLIADPDFYEQLTNKYFTLYEKNLVTSAVNRVVNTAQVVNTVQVVNTPEVVNTPQAERVEQLKIWTLGATKALIALVKKYDDDFQSKIKKQVWQKIANEISNQTKVTMSAQQCDTKWKGLKDLYKSVKQHNDKSGNEPRIWIYFDEMDELLCKKPEIIPPVTCSSSKGLQINNNSCGASSSASLADHDEENGTPNVEETPKTSGTKRVRRYENAADKRHREKLQRQDRFLDLFEDMISTLKNK